MRINHIQIAEDSAILIKIRKACRDYLNARKPAEVSRALWIKFMLMIGVCAVAYLGMLFAKPWGLLLLSYITFGVGTVLLGFNFAHDLSHNAVFKSKTWNHIGYTLIFTLLGAHSKAWKQRHTHNHHKAPNVHGQDTDLEISSLIRLEPSAPQKQHHRWQHVYAPFAYLTYSLFWILVKDTTGLLKGLRRGNFRWADIVNFALQKASYMVVVLLTPMFFQYVGNGLILISFFLMHFVLSAFLLFTFLITHHVGSTQYFKPNRQGHIPTSWLNNQLESSNDFYPFSRAANFIFGGFNNHLAHHLLPAVPHVYYPALSRIIYQILHEHDRKVNCTTYWQGIAMHLRHLKTMGN